HQAAHRVVQTAERRARQDLIERLSGLNARRTGSRRYTAAEHRRRIGKIRTVENVVNVPAQDKPCPFRDCEILGQGHVQLLEILAGQSFWRGIAELAGAGTVKAAGFSRYPAAVFR